VPQQGAVAGRPSGCIPGQITPLPGYPGILPRGMPGKGILLFSEKLLLNFGIIDNIRER